MTKTKMAPECAEKGKPDESVELSSLEEAILRMRYGLISEKDAQPQDRKLSDELKKKLQFLELKAFEQSGKIKALIAELETKEK